MSAGNVWRATHEDLNALTVLAKEFHALSKLSKYTFSPSGTRRHIALMLACPNSIIFMHENGVIGGTWSDYPFCDVRIAKEAFWYSRKQGLGGMVLLKAWKNWVDDMGANVDLMTSIEIEGQSMAVLDRAFRMAGYLSNERVHMRVV